MLKRLFEVLFSYEDKDPQCPQCPQCGKPLTGAAGAGLDPRTGLYRVVCEPCALKSPNPLTTTMKKGYKETLPLGRHDQDGLPIWGPEKEKDLARKRREKAEKPPKSERLTVLIGWIFIFAGVVWVIWRN